MMTVGVLIGLVTGQYASGGSDHTLSGSSALLALLPLVVVFVLQGSTEEAVPADTCSRSVRGSCRDGSPWWPHR